MKNVTTRESHDCFSLRRITTIDVDGIPRVEVRESDCGGPTCIEFRNGQRHPINAVRPGLGFDETVSRYSRLLSGQSQLVPSFDAAA